MKKVSLFTLFVFIAVTIFAQSKYDGEKDKKGEPQGKGIMYWGDTLKFEGQFKKGLPYNEGTYTIFREGKLLYTYKGQIKSERLPNETITIILEGYGESERMGDFSYKGQFKNSMANGKGVMNYSDGGVYDGLWKDDKPHGKGKITFKDGIIAEVIMENNKVKEFIKKSYPDDNFTESMLGINVPYGYVGAIEYQSNVNDATRYFRDAVKKDDTERAVKLLEAGASPLLSPDGFEHGIYNPIYTAIDNKNTAIIEAMLKKEPNVVRYSQAIHYACVNSDSTMIDYLISKGASLDLNGYVMTTTRGDGGYGQYTFQYSWNRDLGYQYTPADNTLMYGKTKNLNYLERKYNKKPTKFGVSRILVRYIKEKNMDSIKSLLDKYPTRYINTAVRSTSYFTSNQLNKTYTYPLIAAIEQGNKDIIKLLIEKGAYVDVRTWQQFGAPEGITPLFLVVKKPGMQEIIEILISKGARTKLDFIEPSYGKTAYRHVTSDARDEYKEWFLLQGITE